MTHRTRSLAGYTAYRTSAPALLRLLRSKPAAEAGFIALILSTGFALDRLAGVVITVADRFVS